MKKYITSVAISIFAVGLTISGLLLLSDDEILIQSLESRTLEDRPVYNKIKLIRQKGREIWMMNQSHSGLDSKKWERLAIVIDGARRVSISSMPASWFGMSLYCRTRQPIVFHALCVIVTDHEPFVPIMKPKIQTWQIK